jgi:hypothetical protein
MISAPDAPTVTHGRPPLGARTVLCLPFDRAIGPSGAGTFRRKELDHGQR